MRIWRALPPCNSPAMASRLAKKGWMKLVQLLAGRRQREGPPLEERHPQVFLQLRHLPAHRRLLNAVRDVAHRLGNAAVPGDVIKQLQMVDVHQMLIPDHRQAASNSQAVQRVNPQSREARVTDAKEVGVGNPAEETFYHPDALTIAHAA